MNAPELKVGMRCVFRGVDELDAVIALVGRECEIVDIEDTGSEFPIEVRFADGKTLPVDASELTPVAVPSEPRRA